MVPVFVEDAVFGITEPLDQPRLGLRRMAQVAGKPLFEIVGVGLLRVVRTRRGLGKGKLANKGLQECREDFPHCSSKWVSWQDTPILCRAPSISDP
jgi:hypothetical protein